MQNSNEAMREALNMALNALFGWQLGQTTRKEHAAAVAAIKAALALPYRQCDVGTAEEQYSRMFRKCYEWMCRDCKSNDKDFRKCALSWAQMPCEEEATDGDKEGL